MEGPRARRIWRQRQRRNGTLLPLHIRRLSSTVSCWFCDFKTSVFNEPLFLVGRRNARFLRVWFSVGVGFGLTAILGVCMILLWEAAEMLNLYQGNAWLAKLFSDSLFGISPPVFGLNISFADVGCICISTVISVTAHEFGHALAAASEGIQIEYVAVFVAVLIPGALVAFNDELLQALPTFAVLRIFCAGIWHNAACCAVCGIALFLLPLILHPFYIHAENPMVLDVSSTSPLSGFLSPGDVITSIDGISIHDAQEWKEIAARAHEQTLKISNLLDFHFTMTNGTKGYCVPHSLMEVSERVQLRDGLSTCANEFMPFATLSSFNSGMLDDGSIENNHQSNRESIRCLVAKDIVKLNKCGNGWVKSASNKSSCLCSEDESCLTPVQTPGLTWLEITYSRPYSLECRQLGRKLSAGVKSPYSEEMNCSGAFVFVGDVIFMAHSIWLTAYRPRGSFSFGAFLPSILEKIFLCTFHVSLVLAFLNSLPQGPFFLSSPS
ncbi:membrane-bound transcription factor site-2 protease homolog isoform X2 [Diospyros lotus]|uniref:membrane-bound transcription factor site-2 protease homolog isoform X2 n=1 Tax=Diospyros lotus TaxID=55363 RepID=UPI002255E4A9|nr:membrane-bound transcription factor site-2 protease homolog isoform X2 [Diospyros lotus]XP_052201793.1 membrane-bound transcription factor site-2 protease homolog isoform X2 [Diospyros lotus]XP_052201794.1 membrane-bound transcription factor site-2 protease homolog isoform X2 [Diospyros lotus]